MAGGVIRVLNQRQYDLGSVGNSNVSIVMLQRRIDVARWREVIVLARLHTVTWGAGASIAVQVGIDGFTTDDPGIVWGLASGAAAGQATLFTFAQGTDGAPIVKAASVGSSAIGFVPPLIYTQFTFTQAAAAAAFKATLSVDLLMRGE